MERLKHAHAIAVSAIADRMRETRRRFWRRVHRRTGTEGREDERWVIDTEKLDEGEVVVRVDDERPEAEAMKAVLGELSAEGMGRA